MASFGAPTGRERELQQLTAILDAHADLPGAVLIEGEAGIGKTTLWLAALEEARARSLVVLEARPAEAESALSFSALADLLQPVLDGVLPALPRPQRDAIEAALLLRPSDDVVLDQRAVGTAALGAIRTVAADRPVLVAIDDVQWLDPASAATLGFALRRLRDEPVAGLFAARTQPGDPSARQATAWMPTTVLEVGPLSLGATHALVFEQLDAVVPRPLLRRLHTLSRGNPFYALELTRAWQSGTLRLAETEPLPPNLADLLGSRIAALPPATRRILAVAAAMSRPSLAALERADGTDPTAALEPASAAQVVEIGTDEVRFAHPLLAAAAHAAAAPGERRRIHARLAEVADDPEDRARHLARAAGAADAAIATEVEAAAEAAFRRGAPSSAADMMADASRLTPTAATADRRRRALTEAEYRFEAGDPRRAETLIGELLDGMAPGPDRARLLARLARVRHFGENIDGSIGLLREALAEAGEDTALRVEIEEGLVWGLLLVREPVAAAERHARSAVRYAERLGDEAALAEALAALAMSTAFVGRDPGPAMRRALALEPATLGLRVLRHPSFAHGYLLSAADDLDGARAVFGELRGRADAHGDDSAIAPILNHLSLVECLAGDLALASSLADEADAMALQSGQVPSRVSALGRGALAAAMRGDVEAAGEIAGRSLALAVGPAFDPAAPQAAAARGGEVAIWALGHLALSLGDHAGADRHLGPLCGLLLTAGVREPGEMRPLADEVEGLAGIGRLEEAARLTELLAEMGERTRRPSVHGTAARSRAIIAAAGGDVPPALAHAERAVEAHRSSGMPLELARSLLVLGTTRRRMRLKRAAREAIEEAIGILDRIGARTWSANGTAELARIGGRAPATGELTPTERRAAELVAEGHSNKEIASLMYISPKTVEANLSRVYAKLGVGSRTELVRRLTEPKAEGEA